MGILAEAVKQAAPTQDSETSAFLTRLNKLEQQAAKPSNAESDLSYMTEQMGLPTAKQEMWQNTLRMLAKAGLTSAQFGALLRAMRARGEDARRKELLSDLSAFKGDVPGRGVLAPVKMAGLGTLAVGASMVPTGLRAMGTDVEGVGDSIKNQSRKLYEHLFATTGKAEDNPLFYPLMLATVLGSGYAGYKGLDEQLDKVRGERASREIEQAKKEFERALSAQYQQAQMAADSGVKTSAERAGMVVDGLAKAHVSGELARQLASLEKAAAGDTPDPESDTEAVAPSPQPTRVQSLDALDPDQHKAPWTLGAGNKALGIYLATLALLAAAGAGAGYHGVKAHETSRRKYDVARELLRRRALGNPPVVTTEA
jgi:hypothetical protein